MQLIDTDSVNQRSGKEHPLNWPVLLRNIIIDACCACLSLALASSLVSGVIGSSFGAGLSPIVLGGLAVLSVLLLAVSGVYRLSDRYVALRDLGRIAIASSAISLAFMVIRFGSDKPLATPAESVLLFFFMTSTVGGVRVLRRAMSWRMTEKPRKARALIIGAGDAGEALIRELQRSSKYDIVGILDDNPNKLGMMIHSVRVLGNIDELPVYVKSLGVVEVLIALPSAQGSLIRKVYELATEVQVAAKTLPGVQSLIDGDRMLALQLRDIRPEDLLRRGAVASEKKNFAGYIAERTVLVTGGGGSIGSELARQIAVSQPQGLVLLGRGENSVYEIEQELINAFKVKPSSEIADIRNLAAVERVFDRHHPDIVLHAAAHKHVPLMEANPIEAIENNIRGTWNLVQLAIQYRCPKFILVSTDKAVNPKSVMGASKRVCELIVQSFAQRSEKTSFAIVRFGNVLGSRGSIMPLLMKQIQRGGPVTITDPDMTRYFMTIPEAADLILQAGAFGQKGEIFLLDMGEPVRIKDLAYDLIRMHGLVPEKDLPIQITGARPGEKTFEELTYEFETSVSTPNEKIRQLIVDEPVNFEQLDRAITELFEACRRMDDQKARTLLMDLANERTPVRG